MTRNLAARIERLEARQRVGATKIIGILNYCDSQGWPKWGGVHRPDSQVIGVIGGVRTPCEDRPERCRTQQADLQQALRGYAKLLNDEPQAEAPAIMGNDCLAPLPAGKKLPRYIKAYGHEIDAFTLTRN